MQDPVYFTSLFQKYLDNRCSPEEVDVLMELLRNDAYRDITGRLLDAQLMRVDEHPADKALKGRLEARLQDILAKPERRSVFHIYRWVAAAAILVSLALGGYFIFKPASETGHVAVSGSIAPGSNKAVLTLSDGSMVNLDSAEHQAFAQGSATIRQHGGQLTYDNNGNTVMYNTLNTPRGAQFGVTLPDGTKVRLNAASSLRYPTAFTGPERVVEVNGEAWFDVTKNAAKPFRVKIAQRETVEVLGTSFNIHAYTDEADIRTTLLDGSVRVGKVVLQPGQQAVIQGSEIKVKVADVDAVMAWKNGYFIFRDTDISTIMREVARWYDIEVINQTSLPYKFNATIPRDTPLPELLEILSLTHKVKFITTGRKVTVQP